MPPSRDDERPRVRRRKAREHDFLHKGVGVEVTNCGAVGEKITGHTIPHTWFRTRCGMHGRDPGNEMVIRDFVEEKSISAKAENEGHGVCGKTQAYTLEQLAA